MQYHSVPRELFAELSTGAGGPASIRTLAAAQYSKHQQLLLGVLKQAGRATPDQAAEARRAYDLLAAAEQHDAEAAAAVISYPSVGAWALHTVRATNGVLAAPGASPSGLAAVAAAAAIRAGLPGRISLSGHGPAIMLPSLGAVSSPNGAVSLENPAAGASVAATDPAVRLPADLHRDGPGWQALRRIRAGSLQLIVDDLDPFRMPAVTNLSMRLPAAEISRWELTFQTAWQQMTRNHPAIAAEVAAAARVVVPMVDPPEGQTSSSSGETFGAIAMSRPDDARSLMVTLVHEVQHLKLCALIDLVRLTRADDQGRFYAPWREDPRPASGLLQGTYAYLGVSRFWRQQRRVDLDTEAFQSHVEFARWRAAAAHGAATLTASGALTEAGMAFAQGISRTLARWLDEPVPGDALARASQFAEQHRSRWQAAHGRIPG